MEMIASASHRALYGTVPTGGPRAWTCTRPLYGRGGTTLELLLAPRPHSSGGAKEEACGLLLPRARFPLSISLGDSLFGSLYTVEVIARGATRHDTD